MDITAQEQAALDDRAILKEAWLKYPKPVDVITGEPVDDWGYEEYAREAFIAGATWASCRPSTKDTRVVPRRCACDGCPQAGRASAACPTPRLTWA